MTGRPQVCDRCRWKKIKCDGNAQACANCGAAGLKCHTTQKLSKRSSPKSYVQSMEARLQDLETELETAKRECADLRRNGSSLDPQLEAHTASKTTPNFVSNSILDQRVENTKTDPINGPGSDDPIVREVGRMVSNTDEFGRFSERFMGSSSGIFFLGTAFGSYQASVGSHSSTFKPRLDDLFAMDATTRDNLPTERGILDPAKAISDLPSRDISARLISTFFEHVHAVLPVLHQPSFLKSVQNHYADPLSRSSGLFLPQLYVVLAIGARYEQFTKGGSRFRVISPFIRYYHAAKDQIVYSTGPDDLRVVQTLTLEALLHELHSERTRGMQVIAKAARLALSLGMHRHSRRFSYSPLMAAMRVRVFWCIYMLDMFTASVAGIPKFLRDYDIDVEEPFDVDDEDITPSNFLTGLPGERTQISGFISICKLSKIMSQTLETLYTTTDRRRSVAKMTTMQKLLTQWQDTHQGYDFGPKDSSTGDTENGEAPLLIETYEQLLYHYTTWLVYRPALSFPTSSLHYERALSVCAEAAAAMIATARRLPEELILIHFNPGAHSFSLWSAGITVLFQHWGRRSRGTATDETKRLLSQTRAICDDCVEVLTTLSTRQFPGTEDRLRNMVELYRGTFDGTSSIPSYAALFPDLTAIMDAAPSTTHLLDPPQQPDTLPSTQSPVPPLPSLQGKESAMQPPSTLLDPNLDLDLASTDLFSGEWFPLGFSPEKIHAETFDLLQDAGFEYEYWEPADKKRRLE